MKPNTLVRIKSLPSEKYIVYNEQEIFVVSRVLKTVVEVRISADHFVKVKSERLEKVEVSGCETISFSEFHRKAISHEWDKYNGKIIVGNEIRNWVGFGWICEGYVKEKDLKKWPRVVDDEEHKLRSLSKKFGI